MTFTHFLVFTIKNLRVSLIQQKELVYKGLFETCQDAKQP